MLNHLDVFKSILVGSYINDPDSPVLDCSQIPIQVSIDATAVDGKLSTRKSDNGDPDFRLLYGLNGGCTQQPLIVLEEAVGKDLLKKSKPRDKEQFFIVNGMPAVEGLLKDKKIERASSYIAVMAIPLLKNPKPYCLALIPVGLGFDTDSVTHIHNIVCQVFSEKRLQVVSVTGDGDKPLRCHQWLPLYDDKIGYKFSET